MCVGVITILLKEKGYRVGDLSVRLWHTKGIDISHGRVVEYCRASDRSYGKPEVWEAIDECLKDMGVEWDGNAVLPDNRCVGAKE